MQCISVRDAVVIQTSHANQVGKTSKNPNIFQNCNTQQSCTSCFYRKFEYNHLRLMNETHRFGHVVAGQVSQLM